MSWAQQTAVQLFNDSKLAVDTTQKLRALQQLGELIFVKETSLVPQFGAALLELQAEPAAAVRKFIASALADVAAKDCNLQLLQACAAAASRLLHDDSSAVVKRALLSATGVFRMALAHACTPDNAPEAQAAWSAARALCTEALALASSAESVGVRLQAIKFVEAATLMLTVALGASPAAPGGVERGVPVAAPNALAPQEELRERLRGSLELLTTQLRATAQGAASGPVAVVLVDAAGNIARQRPHLIPDLLPTLLQVAERTAAAAGSAQAASMAHSLKTVFVLLLRAGVLQSWQERVVSALGALGLQDAADAAVRHLGRSSKRDRAVLEREQDAAYEDEKPLAPSAKKACTEAASGDVSPSTDARLLAQVVSALGALASGDLAMLNTFITQLHPTVLADVVLVNMEHLPPTPPAAAAHAGSDVAMPGLAALFSSAAAPPAPVPPPAVAHMARAPDSDTNLTQLAGAAVAAAPPAPLVAQQLGSDARAAQRRAAAARILRGDERKIVTASGGDVFQCAVLARVGAVTEQAFGEELLAYLLEDYYGRQGHARVVQWLYCVYVADLTPQQAKRGYDSALLAAARGLLQKLSARDRALPLLFVDAPVLPVAALEELAWLVGLTEQAGAQPTSLEQRTLGLITLRDVVMHRQQERAACLALVLRCTVHDDDALRGKSIRMVVNQLHPLPFAARDIEHFASERLESLAQLTADEAAPDDEAASAAAQARTEEALRRISLYFALCTRAEALLPRLFSAFAASDAAVQLAFHRNMAGLARTLGTQAQTLLHLVESPPAGSEALALQAFQALCEADVAIPPHLLQVGRSAYVALKQDVRFLLPCLHVLSREELRALLPQLVALSTEEVVAAFRRVLEVPAGLSPVMSAAEILVALHGIDAAHDNVQLKKVMDACSACFSPQLREIFTPDTLAVALQQLVEAVPLPLLFMRTVIQTATVAPKLHGFILDLLSKLVLKQVWKTDTKLWQGVLRCAKQLVPRSFPVYLQLPAAQLKEALEQSPDLATPLKAYAGTPAVRPTVPGATLELLAAATPAAVDNA